MRRPSPTTAGWRDRGGAHHAAHDRLLVVWWQPGRMDGHVVAGLHSLYERLFSQEHGIRGLNPLCEGRICESVSNLAGLSRGPRASSSRSSRSSACAAQGTLLYPVPPAALRLLWLHLRPLVIRHVVHAPPAVFYAADIALRSRGSYACDGATDAFSVRPLREHDHPGAAGAAHRRRRGLERLSAPRSTARATDIRQRRCVRRWKRTAPPPPAAPRPARRPWGRRPVGGHDVLPPGQGHFALRAVGGWTHPFTVAGRWPSARRRPARAARTCSSTSRPSAPEPSPSRAVAKAGGADAHLDGVAVTGPLPAPPHQPQPTPPSVAAPCSSSAPARASCLALLRMLASQPMPAGARVRSSSSRARSRCSRPSTASCCQAVRRRHRLPMAVDLAPPHSNAAAGAGGRRRARRRRGAQLPRRLPAARPPSGALAAHAAPYGLVAPPGKVPSSRGHVRRSNWTRSAACSARRPASCA